MRSDSIKLPTYDALLEEAGGFGTFQKLAMLILIASVCASGWAVYGQSYLLLYPDYNCKYPNETNYWNTTSSLYLKKCNRAYFCDHQDVQFFRDEASTHTLDNWIKKYDMDCTDHNIISMFGMLFFTGWAITSLIIPPLADVHGRKNIYVYLLCTNLFTFIVPMVLPGSSFVNVYIIIASFFINGLMAGGKTAVGYCYMLELLPEYKQTFFGTLWLIVDGSTFVFLTIYYRFISRNWFGTFVIGAVQLVLTIPCIIFFVPESPKWLYEQQRFDELYVALSRIAQINGVADSGFGGAKELFKSKALANEVEGLLVEETQRERSATKNFEQQLKSHIDRPASASGRLLSQQGGTVLSVPERKTLIKETAFNATNRINLFLMAVVWLSASFGYYLIGYQLKYIKGDLYVNAVITSSSEIAAYLVSGFLFEKFGIKIVLSASFLISMMGMGALIAYRPGEDGHDNQFLISLFVLGSIGGVSCAFNICYLGTHTLFPVRIVATAFGVCNCAARVFTIAAPYVAELPPVTTSQYTFLGVVFAAFASSLLIRKPLHSQIRLSIASRRRTSALARSSAV